MNERRDDVDLTPSIIIAITTAASRDIINRNNRGRKRATLPVIAFSCQSPV